MAHRCGFTVDKVGELDWDAIEKSVLDEVEADTYYCISRLLDGIQVSSALPFHRRTTTPPISPAFSGW